MSEQNFDYLETIFEVNRQRLEAIQAYVNNGGFESILETSQEWYRLMDEQLRVIELIHKRDKQKATKHE